MSWFWLIVIIAGVALDIASSAFIFVGFSLAAVGAIILSFLGVSAIWQFLVFGIISVLFFILVYPRVKNRIKKDHLVTQTMEQTYIGRTLVLPKEINETALIKYEGVFWTFKSNKGVINQGEKVKIIGIEGNKLIVEREK